MRIFTSIATTNIRNNFTPVKKIHQIVEKLGNTHTNSWNTCFYQKKPLPSNIGTEVRIKNEILKSDIMIAEISIPSFGVGYFVSLARIYKIPIVCLFHTKYKKNISVFLSAIIDNNFTLIEYNDKTLEKKLNNFLQSFTPQKKRFNFNLEQRYYQYLQKISKEKKQTITDIIHEIISEKFNSQNT